MYENEIAYKVTKSDKIKRKICSHCVMRVGSNNWKRHWNREHQIYRKCQMTEYEIGEEIPEPFFVSKPFKITKHKVEPDEELTFQKGENCVAAGVMADFIKSRRLKLPYYFKEHSMYVYMLMREDLYMLPPLMDCKGIGWWEIIFEDFHEKWKQYCKTRKWKYGKQILRNKSRWMKAIERRIKQEEEEEA